MKAATKPGVTTLELDEIAGRMFAEAGAISGPKGEYDFLGIHVLVSMKKWRMVFQESVLFKKEIL